MEFNQITLINEKKTSDINFDDNSQREPDFKRPRSTSNDLKPTSKESSPEVKSVKSKNKLKGGGNIEINDEYLDEILHNKNSQMELAMQIISDDKTVRSDTIQYLKDFNCQSLSTQAKKGEKLVSNMPAIKKAFNLMGDDIVELSNESDALKNKIGAYDEKWLEESKAKLLKQIDDEKRANLIKSRMKKQMEKP